MVLYMQASPSYRQNVIVFVSPWYSCCFSFIIRVTIQSFLLIHY
jgi:hypothetical protein